MRAEAQVRIEGQPGSPCFFCRAANLSVGGMYADLGLPQAVGTHCTVRLALPDGGAELVVECVVVAGDSGSELFGAHLAFVALRPEDRSRIHRFVTRWCEYQTIEEALRA